MTPAEAARQLDQIARDLDLVVFSLEPSAARPSDGGRGGERVRRDLESLRDRLADLARALETSG
jgi:hypothetical protein